jgi:hypothetical protein
MLFTTNYIKNIFFKLLAVNLDKNHIVSIIKLTYM